MPFGTPFSHDVVKEFKLYWTTLLDQTHYMLSQHSIISACFVDPLDDEGRFLLSIYGALYEKTETETSLKKTKLSRSKGELQVREKVVAELVSILFNNSMPSPI